MNAFQIKCGLARLLDILGLSDTYLKKLNKRYKNNYIRILNYHGSSLESRESFVQQINWFSDNFDWCSFEEMKRFLKKEKEFKERPGILITFDDGFMENYKVAYPILRQHDIKAMFMIPVGLIGEKNYNWEDDVYQNFMGEEELRILYREGNEICCHTFSHHRMNAGDAKEVLDYEIVYSKSRLEEILEASIEVFCWCGGEEETYTSSAAKVIRNNYSYGMMTNSLPIVPSTDAFQLDRINVEAHWPLALVKFQICGFMDLKLKRKRDRVHVLTGE